MRLRHASVILTLLLCLSATAEEKQTSVMQGSETTSVPERLRGGSQMMQYEPKDWEGWANQSGIAANDLEAVFCLILTSNTFRLAAAKDIERALDIAGAPAAKKKWQRLVGDDMDQQILWNDFFSSAVIWIGGIQGEQGVVAFYNPWIDAVLLSHWRGQIQNQRLMDFEFVTGETWRNEELTEGVRTPAWQRDNTVFSISLAKYYHSSLDTFNRLYPLEGETVFLPPELGKNLTGERKELDLAILHARIVDRISLLVSYLKPKEDVALLNEIREGVRSLQNAITNEDTALLLDLAAEEQEQKIASWIVQLPQAVRSTLLPTYFFRGGDRAVVALSSPFFPKWYLVVYFDVNSSGKASIDNLELIELEAARVLLAEKQ